MIDSSPHRRCAQRRTAPASRLDGVLKSSERRRWIVAAAGALLTLRSAALEAVAWPATTRIVLPASPGGVADQVARTLSESLSASLRTTVVFEYRLGAAGLLAAKAVATAPPDGSVVLLMHSGHVTQQALTRRIDLLGELTPVTALSAAPLVLLVAAASPHQLLADLLAAIAKAPNALNFGSQGIASPSHLAFERLAQQWPGGLRVTHVPFKSPTEPPLAVAAREIDFCFEIAHASRALVQAGRLRPLAITSAQRSPGLPDVPTIAEGGAAGFSYEPWFGLALPAGASPALVNRLAAAVHDAAARGAFRSMIDRFGGRVELSASPQQFAARLRAEIQADAELIARLGIKAE